MCSNSDNMYLVIKFDVIPEYFPIQVSTLGKSGVSEYKLASFLMR